MRTVRSFPIIAFAVPLALAGCGKDSDREAKSPNTASYQSQAENTSTTSSDSTMTPASRMQESQGTATSTTTPAPQNEGAASEATRSTPLTDTQIAAVTDAANTAEVDAGKIAVAQAKNARVRKFAQMMIDHHGKAKRDQEKLVTKLSIQPEESPKVRDLRTSAADTERTLKAAPSDMFDKVYIDMQVADHQMVLDTMDRELIPNVQNPELEKSLQDQRAKVEQHLKQALELQKSLMSSTGATGSKLKPETTGPNNASGSRGTSGSGTTPSGGSSSSGSGTGTGSGAPSGGAAPGGAP
jgi:putative membrane protein